MHRIEGNFEAFAVDANEPQKFVICVDYGSFLCGYYRGCVVNEKLQFDDQIPTLRKHEYITTKFELKLVGELIFGNNLKILMAYLEFNYQTTKYTNWTLKMIWPIHGLLSRN
jgi:hypothetical protein